MNKRKRIMKSVAALAMAAILLVTGQSIAPMKAAAAGDGDQIIDFPDAKLKQALIGIGVDTNGDGNITRKEMADRSDPVHIGNGLSSLNLGGQGITNLTGLEYAVNVTSLSLGNNQITDIGPLAGMSNVETLSLDNNKIRDLSPLAGMKKLRFLSAPGMQNSDLRPLASVGSLEYLFLQNNGITDISPLASLTSLKAIQLFHNQVSDLGPLAGLTDLRQLDLVSNNVSSLKPLAKLARLDSLKASDNKIGDVSSLAGLTALQTLHLDVNQIGDISAVAGLNRLYELLLDDNQIADVSPLSGLTNLEVLAVNNNRVTGLSPLASLRKLQALYVFQNQIADLSPVANLTELVEASFGNNQISDLTALSRLTKMNALNLSGNRITDVSPLPGMTALEELNLEDNRISDVKPLVKLTNLKKLWISGNPIADAGPLSDLKKLTELFIDKANSSSLEPVVKGVTEGGFYNTGRVVTFDRGEAKLNDKPFASGTTVGEEGGYSLFVIDKNGISTTVHFVIDKTPPVVTGVSSGQTYQSETAITFNEGKAMLNGKPIGNGKRIDEDGDYRLIVTDQAGNRTIVDFKYEGAAPAVRGVAQDGYYTTERTITFDQGTATLDGMPVRSGDKVSAVGAHKLAVTGKDGKTTTIAFTIRKQTDGPKDLQGVSEWAKPDLAYAGEIGLILPVESENFTNFITREQFSQVAVKLYEALTGTIVPAADINPFKDTGNPEILKAYRLGIVSGTSDDVFSPNDRITREQLAAMLMRALDNSGKTATKGEAIAFADRDAFSSYAREAIDFMSSIQVINGVTETTFGPKQNASIEQAVIMATRLHAFVAKSVSSGGNSAGAGTPSSAGGAEASPYAFDGSQFKLYVQKTYPQPDGTDYKIYGYKNVRSITLPPYSAIYLTVGTNYPVFEEDYYNYRFGGQIAVSNHTDKSKVVQAGAIDASLERIYRDNMGTVGRPDGTSFTLKATGPYMRLIAYNADFDEAVPYKTYLDEKKDLFTGDWITIRSAE